MLMSCYTLCQPNSGERRNDMFPLIRIITFCIISFSPHLKDAVPNPTKKYILTRALLLGYLYNAPQWGGYFEPPPSDLRNYWTDSNNSSGIRKPWKNCWRNTNFNDLGVTSDVTGQVKAKMFDFSGLVTSASTISMLSSNKANKSAWIVSLIFVSIISCAL